MSTTTQTQPLEWSELWDAARSEYRLAKSEKRNPVPVETTAAMYDEMLCVLPPECYVSNGFLVGEPWSHNERDEPIFAMFTEVNGRFFCQYATVREARTR